MTRQPAPVLARSAAGPSRPITVSAQIQRCGGVQCPPGSCNHEEQGTVHRHVDGVPGPAVVPAGVLRVLGTSGQALDGSTRAEMEVPFGHDFGRVRVHTDAEAARSARAIHARAYTFGQHVVMAEGMYQPHTVSGMNLLAHELTHVVQQANPTGDSLPATTISHPHDSSEREADRVASALTGALAPRGPGPSGFAGALHRVGDRAPIPPERAVSAPPSTVLRYTLDDCEEPASSTIGTADPMATAMASKAKYTLIRYRDDDLIGKADQRVGHLLATNFGFEGAGGHLDAVIGGYEEILAEFVGDDYQYECEDDCGTYYGQVYPFWTDIHLCFDKFKDKPITFIAGVMLHEMSHYAAGTDDLEYFYPGTSASTSLRPTDAISNADSYEGFAEKLYKGG